MILWLIASALARPAGVQVELSDTSPASGDHVYFRVSWANDSSEAVRVPADLLDRLVIRAYVEVPWEPNSATTYTEKPAEPASELAASGVAWQTVPAFGTLERIGDLGEFVPQCRDGCSTGDYQVHASLDAAPISGLAGDQVAPQGGTWDWPLQIRAPSMPVARADAAKLELRGVQISKGVATVDLRVNNTLEWDAYFPDAEARIVNCGFSWSKGKKPQTAGGRLGTDSRLPWHESDALLIPKGESADIQVTCDAGKAPEGSKDLAVKVTIRARSPFVPLKRSRTPFWFAGDVSGTFMPNEK
jgi:hypothetical protein